MGSNWAETVSTLKRILGVYYAVLQGVDKLISFESDGRAACDVLLVIYTDAVTALLLCSPIAVPEVNSQARFLAVAPLGAIARSVLDAYLNLYEVFLRPRTAAEKEFDIIVWNLVGLSLPATREPLWEENRPKVERWKRMDTKMWSRLSSNPVYQNLSKREMDKLKGFIGRHRHYLRKEPQGNARGNRYKAAGLGRLFEQQYPYYCAFAHADWFACNQVSESMGSLDEQQGLARGTLLVIIAILSKIIVHYVDACTEAGIPVMADAEAYADACSWSAAAAAEDKGESDT